ncbi:MAG: hypothetical protein MI685_05840 [Chlorobiales bacterium]|nr:hypothetical protein [Chlorobiales bacterium]
MFRKLWRKHSQSFIVMLGASIWAIIILIAIYLYFKKEMETSTFLQLLVAFFLAVMPLYFILLEKNTQLLLIGLTSKYLIEKNGSNLDDLLGILIARRWKVLKRDPIEEFFGLLKRLCREGNYEVKRRIAESLPALFKIDLSESKEIVELLRCDWDEERWKGDNRRRVIESLPLIMRKEKKFTKSTLQIIERDEIYTLIAIVEVIDNWKEKISKKGGDKLFKNLLREINEHGYSKMEIKSINDLWEFLNLSHRHPDQAYEKIESLKLTSNTYLQIGLVRNLKYLCKGYPKCKSKPLCKGNPKRILHQIPFFLQEDNDKNVRRPIAREEMLECLLVLLRFHSYKPEVEKIIWLLMKDKDDIIRLSTFDRIENILEADRDLGSEILKHVIKANHNPKLVDRAKFLKERLAQNVIE